MYTYSIHYTIYMNNVWTVSFANKILMLILMPYRWHWNSFAVKSFHPQYSLGCVKTLYRIFYIAWIISFNFDRTYFFVKMNSPNEFLTNILYNLLYRVKIRQRGYRLLYVYTIKSLDLNLFEYFRLAILSEEDCHWIFCVL